MLQISLSYSTSALKADRQKDASPWQPNKLLGKERKRGELNTESAQVSCRSLPTGSHSPNSPNAVLNNVQVSLAVWSGKVYIIRKAAKEEDKEDKEDEKEEN